MSIRKIALALSMAGLALASHAQQSLDAKLEQLGKMTYVRVAGLKEVVRDGRMMLQLDLYNEDYRNQIVFWRVRWLDDAGIQVWDDEPWKQEIVYSNQRRLLQAYAPTRKATDFRIELQSPDNDGSGSAKPAGM